MLPFVEFELLPSFCFLSHTFGFGYARNLKGFKDSDGSLVSKINLNQKTDSLGWHPGPGKLGQNGENMPLL